MNPMPLGAAAAAAAVTLLSANSAALAHGFAGERFFPATILTDDPFAADDMSRPLSVTAFHRELPSGDLARPEAMRLSNLIANRN
jgi:hypothetical protein